MTDRKPAEIFPPGEFVRDELEERGWTQSDLAKIMGRPLAVINLIIAGKKAITPETAVGLSSAFGTSAEFWLNLETAFQLAKVKVEDREKIRARAEIFESAPIKDMQKRGWINPVTSVDDLRNELGSFFAIPEINSLKIAARSSLPCSQGLTSEQFAWCVRALFLARSVPAEKFTLKSLLSGIPRLRSLADFPENVRRVPKVLSEMGIRFVVIEHLPKSKIDGAALWLGDSWDKPVIALSVRYDRIDSFWHTLFHEISHIRHKDSLYNLDVDLVSAERCLSNDNLSDIEKRANEDAAEMLIPKDQLKSFISRTKPFYYKEKIIQFANLLKIHPGIIAGQLQFKNEVKWAAYRSMLVKVRHILTASAFTDGWGITLATDRS